MSPNGSSGHSDCHGLAAAWHLDTNMIPHSGLDPLPRHGFQWYQVFVVYGLSVFYTHRGNPCLMKNWQGCFLLFCGIFTLLIHSFAVSIFSLYDFYSFILLF